jgi:hypothetical protein
VRAAGRSGHLPHRDLLRIAVPDHLESGDAGMLAMSAPIAKLFTLRSVTGFNLTAWRQANPDQARHEMGELAGLFAAGRLHATVHARLPLPGATTAHRLTRPALPPAASCWSQPAA